MLPCSSWTQPSMSGIRRFNRVLTASSLLAGSLQSVERSLALASAACPLAVFACALVRLTQCLSLSLLRWLPLPLVYRRPIAFKASARVPGSSPWDHMEPDARRRLAPRSAFYVALDAGSGLVLFGPRTPAQATNVRSATTSSSLWRLACPARLAPSCIPPRRVLFASLCALVDRLEEWHGWV